MVANVVYWGFMLSSVAMQDITVVFGVLIAGAAAVITIRSRVATIWQQEAHGWREKAERLEEDMAILKEKIVSVEREAQEKRHALKDEVAGLRALLQAEQAKTDLGGVLQQMSSYHTEAMASLTAGEHATMAAIRGLFDTRDSALQSLLVEIRDLLKGDGRVAA